MIVGTEAPDWLKPQCENLSSLIAMISGGISYIDAPGNELDPIAVSMAAFMNIVAWLEHLKADKPHLLFNTASGKSYWVKEGGDKWKDLIELGYSPE
jgi:hypothetical protein